MLLYVAAAVAVLLALACVALLVSSSGADDGRPKKGAPRAVGPTAPPPAALPAVDWDDPEVVFTIFAAYSSGDAELMKRMGRKYGIQDERGVPRMDLLKRYTDAMNRITTDRIDLWAAFVKEANGRWAEYARARLGASS
jgi:hypothetical protein